MAAGASIVGFGAAAGAVGAGAGAVGVGEADAILTSSNG